MNAFTKQLRLLWSALWVGTLLGSAWAVIVIVGPLISSEIRAYTYRVFPVVVMTGELTRKESEAVRIHIAGVKLRECDFRGLQAYVERADGYFDDAVQLIRVEGPLRGESKPKGPWDLGEWIIRPIGKGTKRVLVFVEHNCVGDNIRTNIADVELDPRPLR